MTEDSETPRRNTRVACHTAAAITTDQGTFPGVCENLSLSGAFVNCAPTWSSTFISMMLYLPPLGAVEVAGEILRREPRGCGVRFTRLASTALTTICAFVGAPY